MRKVGMLLLIIIVLAGCISTFEGNKPPEIRISTESDHIDYSVGLNYWDNAVYDRIDNFDAIMDSEMASQIQYVALGEVIEITFEKNQVPDEVRLYDYVLDEKGRPKYSSKEILQREIAIEDGTGSFILEGHMATMLSSSSDDYLSGKSIRGFKLICRWGEDECEYGFIIKSDAGMSEPGPETFRIGEMYATILEEVKYIELRNGMAGMSIKVEDRDAIDCIVDEISDVIGRMCPDQSDKVGWRYSIRCYGAKNDAWFELTYGVTSLHDKFRLGKVTDNIEREEPSLVTKSFILKSHSTLNFNHEF
ncbi:hypothetical protein [Petrocella sp. FN5]|uniref:hypothetical protein n=1 Tax=Petrocella sp. FN5 TaxID=3032002 RepID=UPI0023DB6751|nr:hypothetical protein [Petrocella sp. FN5]MDF1618635.1 hypothetical protein [Petrocella sp. FN5]